MGTIFSVVKFNQVYDHDQWNHWVDESIISYHKTKDGAEEKVKFLLEKELENLKELIIRNPHICEKVWEERELDISNNIQLIKVGTKEDYEQTPFYSTRLIHLER